MEDALIIAKLIGTLTQRELAVLRMRHHPEKPMTLEQVGRELGVTRERIRQMEAKALEIIRTSLTGKA